MQIYFVLFLFNIFRIVTSQRPGKDEWTLVARCEGKDEPDLDRRVKIWSHEFGFCKQSPCRVTTRRMFHLEYYFTPGGEFTDKVFVNILASYADRLRLRKRQLVPEDRVVNICNTVYRVEDMKPGCPLVTGNQYVYRARLKLRSRKKDVLMRLKLEDDNEEVYTCFKVILDPKHDIP